MLPFNKVLWRLPDAKKPVFRCSGVQTFGVAFPFFLLPYALLLLLLVGCGGGGKSAKGTSSTTAPTGNGRASITILWPNAANGKSSRLIPANTQSVEITIHAPGYTPAVGHNIMNIPTTADADGVRRSHQLFDQLPTGTLKLTAVAWTDLDGHGAVVAQIKDSDLNIANGETSHPIISLNSAVANAEITTGTGTTDMIPFQSLQLGIKATSAATSDAPNGYLVPVADSDLKWESSDTTKITIDGKGVATSTGMLGPSTITLTIFPNADVSARIIRQRTLEVKAGGLASISITQSSPLILPVGQFMTLTADPQDSSHNHLTLTGLKWETVPEGVAQDVIDLDPASGKVTGLKLGTVLVKVSVLGVSSPTRQINVSPGNLKTVTITPDKMPYDKITFNMGDVVSLTAAALDKDKNQIAISPGNWLWSIDNTAVASVYSSSGASTDNPGDKVTGTTVMVKGKKYGNANITVTETGSGQHISIPVTLNIGVTIDPIGPVIANGTVLCTARVTGSSTGVQWSVEGGDANGKMVDNGGADGVYTATYQAPAKKTGKFQVTAQSLEDPTRKDTQTVTVGLGSGTVTVK